LIDDPLIAGLNREYRESTRMETWCSPHTNRPMQWWTETTGIDLGLQAMRAACRHFDLPALPFELRQFFGRWL